MATPIYLDYNATTPLDPAVADAMRTVMAQHVGNPSSGHVFGRVGREAVDRARRQLADLIGAPPDACIFTSGGTESNNTVIRGVLSPGVDPAGVHVITSAVEHPATLEPCARLRARGVAVTVLPVDRSGRVDPAAVARAIRPETTLVTIMLAQNEVGTLQPIVEIAAVARERGVRVHTDAAQAPGKIPIDVDALGVDYLSIAGHKLYAPQGVGALYVRPGAPFEPFMLGAGHEGGRRAGTENVLEIVGLGAAAERAAGCLDADVTRLGDLTDTLWHELGARIQGIVRHGPDAPEERLPNTLSVAFPGVASHALVAVLGDRLAVSAGSACHADRVSVSPVLTAMGVDAGLAAGTVRLSVGRATTREEVSEAAALIASEIGRLSSGGGR